MTNTEAKALALVKDLRMSMTLGGKLSRPFLQITADAADYIEATEARHAAELRELKKRFSEAAWRVYKVLKHSPDAGVNWMADGILAPFILPAPDPLVEAIKACNMATLDGIEDAVAHDLRAAMQARGYEWRKIGEVK